MRVRAEHIRATDDVILPKGLTVRVRRVSSLRAPIGWTPIGRWLELDCSSRGEPTVTSLRTTAWVEIPALTAEELTMRMLAT